MRRSIIGVGSLLVTVALACSGGGGGGGGGGGDSLGGSGIPGVAATRACDGSCSQEALSVSQVQLIISQAVAQVQAGNHPPATIAVVDRVGNVLAVFQMTGANPFTTVTSGRNTGTGLDGIAVPSSLAAISKAGTGAYLSSQGNAFTTRTASQIVQENFNPGVTNQPGGPLFGVQFSQLPCGDLVKSFGVNALEGPKRMPLGFAADPGGLPLYINGVPVGGVGIEFDGIYTADLNVQNTDSSPEERVAVAATNAFQAPDDRRANRISVIGLTLRYVDDDNIAPASTPGFGSLPGGLLAVPGFSAGAVTAGAQFLTNASGVVSTTFEGLAAEVLVNTAGAVRYPPIASLAPTPAAGGLTANEVRILLREGLKVAQRARAQIRRPVGSAVRVSISIVDLAGNVLGFVRSPDAPVFGIDVSLQKARSVALFTQAAAPAAFAAAPDLGTVLAMPGVRGTQPFSNYINAMTAFTTPPLVFGTFAIGDRSIGNLSRPFFPDGINGTANGPLSKPFAQWSPFSTGLQLEVSLVQLALILCPFVPQIQALLPGGVCPAPAAGTCTAPSLAAIRNGMQIFAGAVPIFRGGAVVGGIGVSGDGIDQDDMVSFLGLHNAGVALGTGVGNAPVAIRTNQFTPNVSAPGKELLYVSCPTAPFNDSSEQRPCDNK